MTTVFVCEDSLDGILTGVYEAWDSGLGHERVRLSSAEGDSLELFCSYRQVPAELEKAEKVLRTVNARMGEEARHAICCAAACSDEGKADAIYRLIVRGLAFGEGRRAVHCLQDPSVLLVNRLGRKAANEAHRMLGFLRFEELSGGVLYARMEPVCAVLPLIAPHFADRLRQENWVIHDIRRGRFAVHRAGGPWVLSEGEGWSPDLAQQYSEKEEEFRELWKSFCESISIEQRRNPRCQQNFLPLRFRPCMTEFK